MRGLIAPRQTPERGQLQEEALSRRTRNAAEDVGDGV